ncbi:sensor histidine kinase [Cryptosporangium japonicum]|uniref:histidine kinase n=1 Tax=Cryptosporangium japonicum TaxID=80872 RepID=A0ABN0THW4_9ACTN
MLEPVALVIAVPLLLALSLSRNPLPVLVLALSGGAVGIVLLDQWSSGPLAAVVCFLAADLAIGRLAAVASARRSAAAAIVAVAVQLGVTAIAPLPGVVEVSVIEILAVVTAWVIGHSVRQRRRFAATAREQATARAVQDERLRIARELHDLIGHTIGVIAVQAGMGRRVIDTQPAEARNALATIEDVSRDTAAAVDRMLRTLRRADPDAGSAPLDPAPGLADLDTLVTRAAHAGVRVDLRRDGDRGPLPPDLDLSAYRIIQEAVTNVGRHSGADHCDVLVRRTGDGLTIEVTDDGRGGEPVFGHGLTGMRERVSLLGGGFSAGPGPEGGFRVVAHLPFADATTERVTAR